MYRCENCQELWKRDELQPMKDVEMRVGEGEPMPAGECPDCGAVCHAHIEPEFNPKPAEVEREINGFASDMRLALSAVGVKGHVVSTFTDEGRGPRWDDYRILIEMDKSYEISPYASERQSIRGPKKCIGWSATEFTYWPGVRYYADGSGQPPEWEDSDEIQSTSKRDIMDWIMHKIVDDLVNAAFENRMWEEIEAADQEARAEGK
jgi:hypothetical protein